MVLIHDENKLLEQLKSFVLVSGLQRHHANPSVTEADVDHVEALIGFALPPLSKRIYLEAGNGGFGPGYGLYPLNNEADPKALHTDSLVTTYLALHSATQEQMEAYKKGDVHAPPCLPEKVLVMCDWGAISIHGSTVLSQNSLSLKVRQHSIGASLSLRRRPFISG